MTLTALLGYSWDFDDGISGTGMRAIHIYAAVGIHTRTLTITDNDELTDTATQSVTTGESSRSILLTVSPTTRLGN